MPQTVCIGLLWVSLDFFWSLCRVLFSVCGVLRVYTHCIEAQCSKKVPPAVCVDVGDTEWKILQLERECVCV